MEVRQQVTELSGSSLLPVHIDLKGLCYEIRVEVEQSHGFSPYKKARAGLHGPG